MVHTTQGFGDLIRSYRRRAGMTQEELAERAELSPRGLIYLERGERRPQPGTSRRLADALGLSGNERAAFLSAGDPDAGAPDAPPAVRAFLIADVRGYTAFTSEHGDEAAAKLAGRFADIVGEVAGGFEGDVIELRGDEALTVFQSPRGAIRAAVALQQRFADEIARDPSLPLAVGMGIDVGEATAVQGGYRGGALNTAARLCSLSAKGEVLVSETGIRLAPTMEGFAYLDRGAAALKGLPEPVRVFQVVTDDAIPSDVPAFNAGVAPFNNLPSQPTAFVGRDDELGRATDLLRRPAIRLLTLTGPGGTGKTRLGVELASRVADEYADGVCFVALATISDPTLVMPTVAQALGVRETPGQPILTTLSTYLGTKQMLMLLDNFEQILEAGPDLSALLAVCPHLTVLVTSRFVLHVSGEQEFEVPPLEVPDAGPLPSSNFARFDALQLFVQRARMVKPEFSLTDDNARTVVDICRRLDGLPLAIELAAARIKILPPAALLARMDNRLKLLTGGSRDLPGRQQTLRDTIAWSYDLLDPAEQILFSRLSTFMGGCTLEAAEAVCDPNGDLNVDVLDELASLVDKSLLRQEEAPGPEGYSEPRFTMLETIREFALERLQERGEREMLRRRHAEYFRALAEREFWVINSSARDPILEMVTYERDNIRATFHWSLENREPRVGMPIVAYLWIWYLHMTPAEGLRWLQDLLSLPEAQERTVERARGLVGADACAWSVGLVHMAHQYAAEAVDIAREVGDDVALASALIGYAAATPDPSSVEAAREAREIIRGLGMARSMVFAFASWVPAFTLPFHGDVATVSAWLAEALDIGRETQDEWVQAIVLMLQGFLTIATGNLDVAEMLLAESAQRYRQSPDKLNLGGVLLSLGGISRLKGDLPAAREQLSEALNLSVQLNDPGNIAACIDGMAGISLAQTDLERAARLLGAAQALREATGAVALPTSDALNAGISDAVRAALDTDQFDKSYAEGHGMSPEQSVEYALDPLPVVAVA